MDQSDSQTLLRRKLANSTNAAAPVAADTVVSVERVLRVAFARAARDAAGLTLSVLGVSDESVSFDDLISMLSDDMALVGLGGADGAIAGIATMDQGSKAAFVEAQTMGRILPRAAEERPITGTDVALISPVLDRFMSELRMDARRPDVGACLSDFQCRSRLAGVRAAGLGLPDWSYRLFRLTLDFGDSDRQGEVTLAIGLPPDTSGMATKSETKMSDWAQQFKAVVNEAPASLTAVLHRLHVPISTIGDFQIGQRLGLPGAAVGGVILEGPDGRKVAQARLGQAAGLRAVRLEGEPLVTMREAELARSNPSGEPAALGTTVDDTLFE